MAQIGIGQQKDKPASKQKAAIKTMARPSKKENVIYIRWGVTTAEAWKMSNQYGFDVERYTVLRDKKMLAKPERKFIAKALKPKPLAEWETLAKKDNYAAVIAQAIYGKEFEMTGTASGGLTNIMAQSQQLDQRFGFSLYAADMSFEGAKLAGWAYTDADVKPNEKYFYKIKSAIPGKTLKIDSAGAYIGLADYEELPKIQEVASNFGNKTITLSWDYGRLVGDYNAYYIEKSVDGGNTFKKISDLPISNMNAEDGNGTRRMYYIDSLNNNQLNYQYRIAGINPFGEMGPYSPILAGKGKTLLAYVPNIRSKTIDEKGVLKMSWEFDENGNDQISGFILSQALKSEGPYKEVVKNIPTAQRSLSYDKLESSNYFTITAVAKEGEGRTSYPVLVQPVDSVPPAVPTGLMAVIDTTGKVNLKWNANTEKDLLGYKIYRALAKGEEAVPLVDSVWYINSYRDILSLKMMNKKAYYGVSALDQRFNQSAISPLIELKKPNIIPPSPAVITKFRTDSGRVSLKWVNSTDEDIESHAIYRRAAPDSPWVELRLFPGKLTNNYTDEKIRSEKNYQYVVEVKAEGGLKTRSEILSIQTPPNAADRPIITRFYAYPDVTNRRIELSWDDKIIKVKEYQIYKAIKGTPLSLWKVVEAPHKGIYDIDLKPNTEYEYAIMAILQSGSFSEIKTVGIKY
ncbi:hypothetical protein ACFOG5_08955 [Pedobacter fastidiosus]|uniref:Fibronectin type III domain-containing protein n=1 Tax=Pedobacter fastidiosus TaxID=2765361 RepID=A0ABR7KTJ3_9SPHI|nr:fibronectin type III domain-containing protein [Pedobacter fastidiosus]MBC6111313.1 fibronectin type III domain-containing protein [Pedobacter fastidiosus]